LDECERSRINSWMAQQQKRPFSLYLEIYACIIGTKSTIQSFLNYMGSRLFNCDECRVKLDRIETSSGSEQTECLITAALLKLLLP